MQLSQFVPKGFQKFERDWLRYGKDGLLAMKWMRPGRWILSLVATTLWIAGGYSQKMKKPESSRAAANAAAGRETFRRFCASCHGTAAKGDGPAASVLTPPPVDLTTLARRHEGKYPAGYVGAVLMFGRNFAAHGADDMPVWGSRFAELDKTHDPTGQQHVDDVVAYLASLQQK